MSTKIEQSTSQLANAANVRKVWGGIIINVKESPFFAKGSGDDTASFQMAVDYANSIGKKDIHVPAGTYNYTMLENVENITFYGDGVTLVGSTVLDLVSFHELSDRINNIVAGAGDSNIEIVDARKSSSGVTYPVLKSRLDTERSQSLISITTLGDRITAEQTERVAGDEALNNRVDNLIIGSGDGNPEVVDARMSAPKLTTFPTLKARLDAGEQDLVTHVTDTTSRAINVKYPPSPLVAAACDGVTDDRNAVQACIDYLGVTGGTVIIPWDAKILINSNHLVVKPNVLLKGSMHLPGDPEPLFTDNANYDELGSAIILNPLYTIYLNSNAGISNCLMYKKGTVFPSPDGSAFSGTAITVSGSDVYIGYVLILGFTQAIISATSDRHRIEWVFGDNTNGIDISGCQDVPRISNCHFWPFLTAPYNSADSTRHHRSGNGFYLHDTVDGAGVTDCFAFGYMIGFKLKTVSSTSLLGCFADNTKLQTGSKSFEFTGFCPSTTLTNCTSWSADNGYFFNLSGNSVSLVNCNSRNMVFNNAIVQAGDVYFNSCLFTNAVSGVSVTSATPRVEINHCRFETHSGPSINCTVASSNVIGRDNHYSTVANGSTVITNATVRQIASVDPLPLPANGDFFEVTGTTGIGAIGGGWAGRRVTLKFAGILTVFDGVVINMSGDFVTSANDILNLIHDGTQWLETSRSAN